MRILSHSNYYSNSSHGFANTVVQSTGENPRHIKEKDEENQLDLKSLKKKPDYAKTKFEKDEQEKLEKLALAGNSRLDPDQYDMVKKLEQVEREVVMHEKAHQATGGTSVGAVSYQYTMGPDQRYYATGGNVEYKLPFAGTPESMMRAFKGLKTSALSSTDASKQDARMAAMAEAKIQDIKNKISSDKGKLAYYAEMLKEKELKAEKNKTQKLN